MQVITQTKHKMLSNKYIFWGGSRKKIKTIIIIVVCLFVILWLWFNDSIYKTVYTCVYTTRAIKREINRWMEWNKMVWVIYLYAVFIDNFNIDFMSSEIFTIKIKWLNIQTIFTTPSIIIIIIFFRHYLCSAYSYSHRRL